MSPPKIPQQLPIDHETTQLLQLLARSIDNVLNDGVRPRPTDFILLTISAMAPEGARINRVGTIKDREVLINVYKEQIKMLEAEKIDDMPIGGHG